MDATSLATSAIGLQQAQTRAAIATEVVKMQHQADQTLVALIEQAAQAGKTLAATPLSSAGLVDVRV